MQKTVLVDDLDGTEADETIMLSLNGDAYEIDLSRGNAEELRTLLARYTQVARPVRLRSGLSKRVKTDQSSKAGTRSPITQRVSSGPTDTEVRAWAKANKVKVNAKGRIPSTVRAKYLKAQEKK